MIEDKLEIVIPTYNRANYLDNTLNSLLNSPLKDCKITIRDNASQDDTPQICEKYSKLFINMAIIRNKKNIGGNANILKSYENATYPYVWVLADNDFLNFDECDDFLEAIESDKYDLIICSSAWYPYVNNATPTFEDEGISELIRKHRNNDKNYLENNTQNLVKILKKYYFIIATFIPSTIYRTSIFTSDTLMNAYDYISLSYPHYAFIIKSLDDNLLTYKTKRDILLLQKNPEDWEIGRISWYSRYIKCATLIKNKKIQPYATLLYDNGFFYNTFAHIIVAKAKDEENIRKHVLELLTSVIEINGWFKGFFYNILILLCYLIPKRLCKYAFKNKLKK